MTAEDATDDWEDELAYVDSFPGFAIVLGAGAIAIIAAAIIFLLPWDPTLHRLLAFGGAALVSVAAWGVAWLITLRRSGIAWMAGALVAFLAVAAAGVLFWMSNATADARLDMETLRKIRVDSKGVPQLTNADAHIGPLTRRGLAYVRAVMAERKRRDTMLSALHGDEFHYQSTFAQHPDYLDDCMRFTRAKAEIDRSDRAVANLAAAFRRDLAAGIGDDGLRGETLASFDRGWGASRADTAQMSGFIKMQLDHTTGMCTILARRNWRAMGPFVAFTKPSDTVEINAIVAKANAVVEQSRALRGRAIDRINKNLEIAGDTRF